MTNLKNSRNGKFNGISNNKTFKKKHCDERKNWIINAAKQVNT